MFMCSDIIRVWKFMVRRIGLVLDYRSAYYASFINMLTLDIYNRM